jgi:hypothetical protein
MSGNAHVRFGGAGRGDGSPETAIPRLAPTLHIPFEPEAANLFFQLVSARYERASLIVTSNKPFGRWGEVFGDDVVAAAMIDRLVHHANVVALKATATGSRTETRAASPRPPPTNHDDQGGHISPAAR